MHAPPCACRLTLPTPFCCCITAATPSPARPFTTLLNKLCACPPPSASDCRSSTVLLPCAAPKPYSSPRVAPLFSLRPHSATLLAATFLCARQQRQAPIFPAQKSTGSLPPSYRQRAGNVASLPCPTAGNVPRTFPQAVKLPRAPEVLRSVGKLELANKPVYR